MGFSYHHYLGESIYRSKAGKQKVLDLYDQKLAELKIEHQSKKVSTLFGETHVLILGPKDAPPLFLLHPRNVINPLALSLFKPLLKKYRIYAPDLIGHPGKSSEKRLRPKSDKYGKWLTEVMDKLKVSEANFVGASIGGLALLQLAGFSPDRILKAILVNPPGIVKVPRSTLIFRLWLPYFLYSFIPTQKNLLKAIGPHFTEEPTQEWLEALGIIYKNVKIGLEAPSTVSKSDLQSFKAETLLFASEKDTLYSIEELTKRAKDIIPNLSTIEILMKAKHMPSEKDFKLINERIISFLKS